jgi:hypothetical protein
MWRFLLSLPILAIVLATPAVSQSQKQDPKEKNRGLEKGKDLPGPFNPYNVTGPRAGRYHCLVTQTSLDPLVMIVVRDLDFTEGLQALEAQLDNRIDKNPNVRLSSFTVFLRDQLPNPNEDEDNRDDLAAKVTALAKAKDYKHIVLCLDTKQDLDNYRLDDNAWATVILVNKYKVVSVHTLMKTQLNAEMVAQLIGEVAEQLGAKRK